MYGVFILWKFLKGFSVLFGFVFEGGYTEHLLKRQFPTNYLGTFTEKLQIIRVILSSIHQFVHLSETSTTSSRLLYFCLKLEILFFFFKYFDIWAPCVST